MPTDLLQAVERVATDAGLKGKTARLKVQALTDELKRHSRTQAHGGVHDYLEPATHHRTRPKASELREISERLQTVGLTAVSEAELRALLGFTQKRAAGGPGTDEEHALAQLAYGEDEAAAYAVGRLPATYAVMKRVLGEVHRALPDLRPRSMLDYGAGPAPAVWAAQEVWAASLASALAVEPSEAMTAVGRRLQAARELGAGWPGRMSWLSRLPHYSSRRAGGKEPSRPRRYDVVVASYVLSEVPGGAQEVEHLVRQLWERTGDVLVLVEPGTPLGFAHVRDARSLILGMEARRRAKLDAASTGPAAGDAADAAAGKLVHAGAHVVAPCGHDGTCPMQGRKTWCHFAQRLDRPPMTRRAKLLQGGAPPRSYEDERFSYVVLRRGPRPVNPPQVQVTKDFDLAAEQAALHAAQRAAQQANSHAAHEHDSPSDQLHMPRASTSSPVENIGQPLNRPTEPPAITTDADAAQPSSAPGRPHKDRFGAFGLGLIDGLLAMEAEQGMALESSGGPRDKLLLNEAVIQHLQSKRGTSSGTSDTAAHASQTDTTSRHVPHGGPSSSSSHDEERLDKEWLERHLLDEDSAELVGEEGEGEEVLDSTALKALDPGGHAAALANSQSWPRIIRPPRKRGGHIILDMCTPADNPADAAGTHMEARLERHVVTRSDGAGWLGRAGYGMAKSARWGDLWPAFYASHNTRKQVV